MYTTPVNFRANYAKCWSQANNFKQSWSCEILVLWKAENANTTFKRSVTTTLLSHDHFSYIWHTLRATFMINQDSVASSLSKLNNWWKSGRIHVYSLCFYMPKRRSNCIGSFKVWSLWLTKTDVFRMTEKRTKCLLSGWSIKLGSRTFAVWVTDALVYFNSTPNYIF